MNVETPTSIRVSRVIPASRELVFKAWTEPQQLRQWSCPEGAVVEEVEVDLRPGGAYRIRMKTDDGNYHTAVGTYQEIDVPSRLVYTWSWEEIPDMEDTMVTVTFTSRGDSTEVVVEHDRFADEKTAADHEMGWTSCINNLERLFF